MHPGGAQPSSLLPKWTLFHQQMCCFISKLGPDRFWTEGHRSLRLHCFPSPWHTDHVFQFVLLLFRESLIHAKAIIALQLRSSCKSLWWGSLLTSTGKLRKATLNQIISPQGCWVPCRGQTDLQGPTSFKKATKFIKHVSPSVTFISASTTNIQPSALKLIFLGVVSGLLDLNSLDNCWSPV